MLIARTAASQGHAVDLFLAGDAVGFLRGETLQVAQGIGTGSMAEHLTAFLEAGGTLHASGLSSKARGLSGDSVGGLPVSFDPPDVLVRLTLEADRVLTY